MNKVTGFFKTLLLGTYNVLNTSRKIIINVIFFLLLILFIVAITSQDEVIEIKDNSALVLNLYGHIVEQKHEIDPIDAFMEETVSDQSPDIEILLNNVIKVIEHAKEDDRISVLVLDLKNMSRTGLPILKEISRALTTFKESGKKVIANGYQYSQSQYYLASFADEIWLDPEGWLLLDGFGRYSLYYKTALEKLNVSQHIFRVGTYKSAVEPYIRDDMSDAAKEANKLWLNDLWTQYKEDVAQQRQFDTNNFDEKISSLITKLKSVNGNFADYALNNGWVDQLKTPEQVNNELITLTEKTDKNTFRHIGFHDYLQDISIFSNNKKLTAMSDKDKVVIIVAKGTILDGEQAPGTIGGVSTAKLLRKARFDKNVKSVVLRVDSPGGSAFASELIRREVDLLKEAGKPVVASMGTYAASGGYWISAAADKIYAAPTTITGSIGVFGLFMTFEKSLNKLGIHNDGVGTTEFSGMNVTRALTPEMGDIIQLSVERTYRNFLELVAKNRDMTTVQVDAIAQGRVWSGKKAHELGLVDELGNLNDAIQAAANLANLDDYQQQLIEREKSPKELFIEEFLGQASTLISSDSSVNKNGQKNPLIQLTGLLIKQYNHIATLNDPQGVYTMCLTCELN